MVRPDIEALDKLEAMITDLHETEAALKELKARINEVAARLGEKFQTPTCFAEWQIGSTE